jgi:Flp pilus assembly protein TadD
MRLCGFVAVGTVFAGFLVPVGFGLDNTGAAAGDATAWTQRNEEAVSLREQARFGEAERLLLAALGDARAASDAVARAAVLNNLGSVYVAQGRYSDAVPAFARRSPYRRRPPRPMRNSRSF